MTEIFVCKPGAVSDESRAMLKDAGVVVVEMDNPSEFRLIKAHAEPEFEAGEFLKAAIIALAPQSDGRYGDAHKNRAAFFEALAKGIAKSAAAQPESGGDRG